MIIGKLIPAGTGAARYQKIEPDLPGASSLPANLGADWLASLEMPGIDGDGDGEYEIRSDLADAEEGAPLAH